MADERKEYVVTIGDLPHTMLLDEQDAARYGDRAVPVQEKAAPKPANKSRTPQNKK